ncbi:MAG: hypothetical protein H6Q12_616 [Bacteroidetes bacterium]|nr:hypothetical protein [Bacteroidota bacterium]
MGTTFNLELNNKPTRKNTFSIFLRITQNKKHKRIKSSIEVKNKKDFNPKAKQGNWIRTSEANHKVWNQAIENELEEAKRTYRELKEDGLASKELIKLTLQEGESSLSFVDYAKQRAQDIFNEGGYRNFKKYVGFCNKLETFLKNSGKSDLLFAEVTSSYLSKFESFLHTLRNERNPEATLHPNTIAVNLNIFKALINRAIEQDKLLKPEKNPFLGYKYDKAINTIKDKLNEAEIKLIEALELPEYSLIWHCRNYFLFSFYLAGIRAGDLIQLRWCNITSEGRIEYRMAKTKKDRNMNLHQKAADILKNYYKEGSKPSDYIFPLLDNDAPYARAISEEQKATLPPELIKKLIDTVSSKNALINKYLKKIATLARIEKNVSFHIARHSFAKIAKDNKVDNNHLKNLLGHSSIKVTEAYMGNFETADTDKVMASIFGNKEDQIAQLKTLLEKVDPVQLETLFLSLKCKR